MAKKQHHIVHNRNGGWDVKKSGADRVSKHFERKQDAENYARKVSKNQKTELVIHGLDGKIQRTDSHGNDPYPPKDKN